MYAYPALFRSSHLVIYILYIITIPPTTIRTWKQHATTILFSKAIVFFFIICEMRTHPKKIKAPIEVMRY